MEEGKRREKRPNGQKQLADAVEVPIAKEGAESLAGSLADARRESRVHVLQILACEHVHMSL